MVKRNVADLKPEELEGKVVFVRADLNVPQVRVLCSAAAAATPNDTPGCVASSATCIVSRRPR